ncbi:hypothetical protein OHY99_25985 (plasmid) [Serratia marcescens]|uniref:Plasmid replication protein RepL domain-containing protein n=1 Tax=Citrobacter freundii TaxID=546 RepID=A0AA44NFB4_CITFR|nr:MULTISPECIES: hypothetical protein [Enterobacterales]OYQ90780.1 hypothetical protein B9P90_29825 [Citrobacter freundii]OYQ91292.1 hypothetical protein B9P89_29980 [Citrobacter freundii]UYU06765.1 hypothetical protein OHY99_25985 [Serratia marcescens]
MTIQEVKKTRVRTKKENDKLTEYKMNPFVFEKELKIETKTRNLTVRKGTELVSKDNSDESESYLTNIIQRKEVDKEEFIKLFTSQIKVYFDLTKTAYKIFLIVLSLYQKEIGKDYVLLTCKKAQNIAKTLDFELSSPIFYRGIKELIEKKIIAKSVDKIVFYINPAIFFNGDRARFVTEVIKKKEEIEKNQLLQELEDTSKNKDFDVNETDDSVENLDLMIARLQKKKEELERKEKFGNWQDLEDAS